jgi:hypothetical protein
MRAAFGSLDSLWNVDAHAGIMNIPKTTRRATLTYALVRHSIPRILPFCRLTFFICDLVLVEGCNLHYW